MDTRITIDQLERMKTHEVADLLSNVVLLLRRMPNVECRQFTNDDTPTVNNGQHGETVAEQPSTPTTQTPAAHKGKKAAKPKKIADDLSIETVSEQLPAKTTWTVADLEGKTVPQLRQIAKDLNLRLASNLKRDEVLNKLTTKLSRSHSEQYEIQNI